MCPTILAHVDPAAPPRIDLSQGMGQFTSLTVEAMRP